MTPEETQQAFRAILDALAHPTRPFPLGPASAPAPLSSASAAVALTLCDEDTPVWLDETLAAGGAVAAWFAFHTGAPVVSDHAEAAFVFTTGYESLPPLNELAAGTAEEPHRSATVVVTTERLTGSGTAAPTGRGEKLRATGPGINGHAEFLAPAGFAEVWQRNTARFPQGVDLLFVDDQHISGLPRTTTLEGAA